MNIDVLFIDPACSKPYTWESLESDSLGGTECATIRLAEIFAKRGLRVAVVQHFDTPYVTSPNGVIYCGQYFVNTFKPKNIIFIRGKGFWERFPACKKFVWLHDASSENHNNLSSWSEGMIKYSVIGIVQSDWHITNIHQYAPDMPLIRIYPTIDENCYTHPVSEDYDKNQLAWLASPHKGLSDALHVFQRIRQREPGMKLAVFNPGYFEENLGYHENVVFLPKKTRKVVRSVLSKSLCLFYPSTFEETFGCLAAEANALHTPVACYPIAGLKESSLPPYCEDEDGLIETILKWRESRPKVQGQEKFKLEAVYAEWEKVLDL